MASKKPKRARKPAPQPADDPPVDVKVEEAGDTLKVDYTSDVRIRTLDDALQYGEVDTSVWQVKKWSVGSYEVTLKIARGHLPDVPVRKMMWRVHIDLVRILPKGLLDAASAVFERMAAHAPRYPKILRKMPRHPHLLEVDLFDVHFGKLAWSAECNGVNYDLKIAERIYRNAVEDLVRKAAGYAIDRIVLPIGNDFLHVDNNMSATTAGTRVDTDSRFAKMYIAGQMALVHAIEYLRRVAPVQVVLVPGNHDEMSSFAMARTIDAWFRNADDVSVDCGPECRKYVRYGTCLIGYTHGNEENPKDLTGILATERPKDWADTTCHEWRLGHFHRSKAKESISIDTHLGVTTRWMHSLSASDFWHVKKGYVGQRRAAEAYLMSFSEGYTGHFVSYARDK